MYSYLYKLYILYTTINYFIIVINYFIIFINYFIMYLKRIDYLSNIFPDKLFQSDELFKKILTIASINNV